MFGFGVICCRVLKYLFWFCLELVLLCDMVWEGGGMICLVVFEYWVLGFFGIFGVWGFCGVSLLVLKFMVFVNCWSLFFYCFVIGIKYDIKSLLLCKLGDILKKKW